MKLLIAGSRTIPEDDLDVISRAYSLLVHSFGGNTLLSVYLKDDKVDEVVSGKARGADRLGENWAKKYSVPVKEFKANWKDLGPKAGPIRNEQMGNYCDSGIVVIDSKAWDADRPSGSMNMIGHLLRLKKPVSIVEYDVEKKTGSWLNPAFYLEKRKNLGNPVETRETLHEILNGTGTALVSDT